MKKNPIVVALGLIVIFTVMTFILGSILETRDYHFQYEKVDTDIREQYYDASTTLFQAIDLATMDKEQVSSKEVMKYHQVSERISKTSAEQELDQLLQELLRLNEKLVFQAMDEYEEYVQSRKVFLDMLHLKEGENVPSFRLSK